MSLLFDNSKCLPKQKSSIVLVYNYYKFWANEMSFIHRIYLEYIIKLITVDSRYLEVEWTLCNTSRYPYFDISDVQNRGKYQSNNCYVFND